MLPMKNLLNVFKRAGSEYGKDDIGNLAAALAFAAFFSIFPLILFLVSVASFFLDKKAATEWVLQNVKSGGAATSVLNDTVTGVINAKGPATGLSAIIGLVSLILSASGVFGTLQTAINRAWGCEKAGSLVKDKLIAFAMVLAVVVVLAISTVISSLLNGIQQGTAGIIGAVPWLWQIVDLLVSIGLLTAVLTMLFRTMPRCKVEWADVWPGALLTAVLFEILKQAFAFYLGHFANYQAVYGSLGAIIALQTWIFLSAQILLFGAEFCSEYANEREGIEAARATAVNEARARERQAAAARRQAERDLAAGRPAGPVAQPYVAPGAPPAQTATVFATAAVAAAALGMLGKLLGRSAQR